MADSQDYSGEHADYVRTADPEPALGDDVLGDDGELVIVIPAEKYPAGKTATARDAGLVAGNIKDAVTLFGVLGDYAGEGTISLASIQYGTVTIAAEAASGTATITAVDQAKSLLIYLGSKMGTDQMDVSLPRIIFTNATTITAVRASGGVEAGILYANFLVVEFTKGIKSVQNATIAIANDAASGTATITAVNTTKTLLSLLGFTSTSPQSGICYTYPRITLTNTTTITATVGLAIGDLIIGCTLLEFV